MRLPIVVHSERVGARRPRKPTPTTIQTAFLTDIPIPVAQSDETLLARAFTMAEAGSDDSPLFRQECSGIGGFPMHWL